MSFRIKEFHWEQCVTEHLQRNLKSTQYSLNSLKGSIIFLQCAEVLFSATVKAMLTLAHLVHSLGFCFWITSNQHYCLHPLFQPLGLFTWM